MCGSLVGLSSTDVAYVQQAATHVDIIANGTAVQAIIKYYGVSNSGLDVVNIKFENKSSYSFLKSRISKLLLVPVRFVLKHSYFQNLHKSLDRVNSKIMKYLIPSNRQGEFPAIPYSVEDFLWLDKEYQLLALKKIITCDNSTPFLLTGPFGTGKTRVLATAAITFLIMNPDNRVLICSSHIQSADAYIENYIGPMMENHVLPQKVNPIRLVGTYYRYAGRYPYLFKQSQERELIRQSHLIVTTFLTAPQLLNVKVKDFTHILIDEGAQVREPETIAPLCLAADNAKIVIAGDVLQVC